MHDLVDCDGFLEGEGLLLPVQLLDLDLHPVVMTDGAVTIDAVVSLIHGFIGNVGAD
jgi:hypothetical protein